MAVTEFEQTKSDIDFSEAIAFLNSSGDEEIRRFLRRLPVFSGNDGGPLTMKDLVYEMRLQPFVIEAWSKVKGEPGVPGRLLQLAKVFRTAEADMERLTGEKRRLPRVIDVPTFVDVYTRVRMP